MANALTIAGSDSVGGAGLQADLKAFEAVGVHGCSVVTCATSQNTRHVSAIFALPVESVVSQMNSVFDDVKLDAIKTGMLFSPEIVRAVASRLKSSSAPIVVDPVLTATTGSSLHKRGFVEALIAKMIPIARLVTPNLREAAILSGVSIKDEKSVMSAGDEIMELGPDAVLIKGGHLDSHDATDYLFYKKGVVKVSSPRVRGEIHGTGCTLASLVAAHLANGSGLEDAVKNAKAMLYKAVLAREKVGRGIPCANPLAVLRIEAGKAEMLRELAEVGDELEAIMTPDFVPEVGMNLGYAVLGALEPMEVAAFSGRIVRVGMKAKRIGCPQFGASKHVARIILAASSYDPSIRAALNIKFSEENLVACRQAGLSVSTFNRTREPKGVSSMTWGVHSAIEKFGGVPDVIFDRGGIGKEPMIRLLGESPENVMSKARRILSKRQQR